LVFLRREEGRVCYGGFLWAPRGFLFKVPRRNAALSQTSGATIQSAPV
jgi:hypothetical protein